MTQAQLATEKTASWLESVSPAYVRFVQYDQLIDDLMAINHPPVNVFRYTMVGKDKKERVVVCYTKK